MLVCPVGPPQGDSVDTTGLSAPAEVPSVGAKKPKKNKFGLKMPSMLKKSKSSKHEVSRRLPLSGACFVVNY